MKRADTQHRVTREQVLAAANLKAPEVRCLVANYYMAQEMRKRADMQVRHLGDKEDPMNLLELFGNVNADLEKDFTKALEKYAEADPVGQWMLAQVGIGPVISAGLLAHLDITGKEVVSAWWRYAGLDPSCKWEKGKVRPWNADVKQLCFHAGLGFMRFHNNPNCYYGKIYRARKDLVVERNLTGHYAERAKIFFTKSAEVKKTLAKGRLPDGNLDQQARNYAVKMFFSHLHVVAYWCKYKRPPAKPFAIDILRHAHKVHIPHHEMFPGMSEAYWGQGTRPTPKKDVA